MIYLKNKKKGRCSSALSCFLFVLFFLLILSANRVIHVVFSFLIISLRAFSDVEWNTIRSLCFDKIRLSQQQRCQDSPRKRNSLRAGFRLASYAIVVDWVIGYLLQSLMLSLNLYLSPIAKVKGKKKV